MKYWLEKQCFFFLFRCYRLSRCADSGFCVVSTTVYGVDNTTRDTRGHRNPSWTSVRHSKKTREERDKITLFLSSITQIILDTTPSPAHFPARSDAEHKVAAMAKGLKRCIPIRTVCAQVLYTSNNESNRTRISEVGR